MGRVAYRRYSLGLKLSTFIDTESEVDIMSVLHHIKDELPEPVTIKLWYTEGEIKKGQIKRFMQDWSDLLAEYGSQMFRVTENNNRSYDAWFNIMTRDDAKKIINCGRFQYYHNDVEKIWMGIFSFLNVLNFHCKDNRYDDTNKKNGRYESRGSWKSKV